MPFNSLDTDFLSRPMYYTTSWPEEPQFLKELRLNCNEERTEKKMEVRDRICDKCGKRYSVAEMRVMDKNGEYTDKECYLDNNIPTDAYPKMYHSRTNDKYAGRGLDLCSECAEELKKFAGEE